MPFVPVTHTCAVAADDEEKDPDTKNLVLSQFEKARARVGSTGRHAVLSCASPVTPVAQVTHAKNKWKCSLRSGIMTLNGKDYVFNTASGDFTW
jgi:transcription initiation factor TFIIA large subunit